MKKLWIITLLFFYLGSVSGIDVNVHYCNGKLISFFEGQEEKCCYGNKKKSKECCYKAADIKLADQHESAYDLKIPGPAFKYTDLFIQIAVSKNPTQGLPINRVVVVYKPPVRSAPPIYLSNCVLII